MSGGAGPDHPGPRDATLDILAYRLAGSLLLVAGLLLLATLAVLERFEPVSRDGALAYAIPGTAGRHVIDAMAVPILAGAGGMLTLLGTVGLGLGWTHIRWPTRTASPVGSTKPAKPLWRSLAILAAGLLVLGVALYLRR